MTTTRFFRFALTLGVLAASVADAHRRNPGSVNDPAADLTDLYAWVQGQNLVIAVDVNGWESPEAGPNWARFDDDVLYEIHLVRGGTSLDDALTWQFRFTTTPPIFADPNTMPLLAVPNTRGSDVLSQIAGGYAFQQKYTVTQLTNGANPTVVAQDVPVPPPNVGPETDVLAYALGGQTYENHFGDVGNAAGTVAALTGGGQVFAGPRDDPSFEDEGAINDLLQFRPIVNPSEGARNSYAYLNTHAIVLEVPLTVANGGTAVVAGAGNAAQTVGLWASASRRAATIHRRDGTDLALGPWRQVSRVGLPQFQALFIGLQDRDRWSRSTPKDDAASFGGYILNPVMVRDAEALGYYGTGAPLSGCASAGQGPRANRTDLVGVYNDLNNNITSIGDVLRVDLGTTSGFPSGRLLTDHTLDLSFAIILCGVQNANLLSGLTGPTGSEVTLPKGGGTPAFPYLLPPWEGRSANPRPAPSLP